MKGLIIFTALGSLLTAPLAYAGPPRWTPPGHRYAPPPAYGHYYPAHHHHGQGKGGDSDDAAWAIGGLVLGAIIGTAAAKAEQRQAQETVYAPSSTPLPPPQKRKVVTCYDEVAYDGQGEPYVARQCYENWR
jgi:hypothetical protein